MIYRKHVKLSNSTNIYKNKLSKKGEELLNKVNTGTF